MEVLQPVVLEPELADGRVRLDEVVCGRAGVVEEARERQLLGCGVAAHHRSGLEHEHLKPGLGEVGSRDEAVVPGAGDDHVGLRQVID